MPRPTTILMTQKEAKNITLRCDLDPGKGCAGDVAVWVKCCMDGTNDGFTIEDLLAAQFDWGEVVRLDIFRTSLEGHIIQ